MSILSFKLVSTSSLETLKTTITLLEMWEYIKMFVNVPQNWSVEEFDGEDFVDTVNACYLIENYKKESEVPQTVTDIQ